jgi:hypothetical protein
MTAIISQLLAECYPPERQGFKPFSGTINTVGDGIGYFHVDLLSD